MKGYQILYTCTPYCTKFDNTPLLQAAPQPHGQLAGEALRQHELSVAVREQRALQARLARRPGRAAEVMMMMRMMMRKMMIMMMKMMMVMRMMMMMKI